ncbi:MAG: hypothetical protein ACFFDF_17135 [Candidatus Odinarchaeota archaeon]
MSEYTTIKIREEVIDALVKAQEKRGLKPRSNADAVMILINDFLMKNPTIQTPKSNTDRQTKIEGSS